MKYTRAAFAFFVLVLMSPLLVLGALAGFVYAGLWVGFDLLLSNLPKFMRDAFGRALTFKVKS